jgi:hypothetical protein
MRDQRFEDRKIIIIKMITNKDGYHNIISIEIKKKKIIKKMQMVNHYNDQRST